MPEYKFPDQMEWTDPPRNYYLSDVKEKVLHHNPETGFKIALVKAPVGIMDKMHKHSEANQFTLVLTGDKKWTFGFTPKGEVHGGSELKEVVGLFIWDGSPRPEVVE
jgi:quercetin dioxygenase-like cupin family protein